MVSLKPERATANLRMLEFVARKLGPLNEQVIYLGGCTTALFITDPLSLDVRPTKDVDCIVDIVSLPKYYQFGKELSKQGFKQSINESVICRWHYDEVILDVMPTDENVLKFGNRWYKEAIKHAISHHLTDDLIINSVTAPYLLATKIEAFKTRGNGDFLESHDFEDIITVVAGRIEIVDEITRVTDTLKRHLKHFFTEIIDDDDFRTALPGHLNDGPLTIQRIQTVQNRIKQLINA
jgi:hypothetical protein